MGESGQLTHEFHAMGTSCSVTLYSGVGGVSAEFREVASLVERRVRSLERCWSRFQSNSDLSVVNAHAGSGPLHVSDDMWLLLTRMRRAYHLTDGLFDPTVIDALVAAGYRDTFTRLDGTVVDEHYRVASPGLVGMELDPVHRTVSLPAGVRIDPGGIGKGLAGDVVANDLARLPIAGALINLGGDITLVGTPGVGLHAWTIDVQDEHDPDGAAIAVLTVPADSETKVTVATSSTAARRWGPGLTQHHIIDPVTGRPSRTDVVQVTVVARPGWLAEAYATAALVSNERAVSWLAERQVEVAVLQSADRVVTHVRRGSDGYG